MIVASHRGPVSFVQTATGFEQRRGAGGVVSALRPLLAGTDARWIAAAIDDDDRAALAAGETAGDEFAVRMLPLDPHAHRLHYEVVSNATLWFLHHGLFDLPRRPRFDRRFREAWDGYREVNAMFARAVDEEAAEGEIVLVHDYHLSLVPRMLRERRPDLRPALFTHTPFCGPNSIRVLPDEPAREMLSSMAAVPSGFHTPRWARAYEASARTVLGPAAAVEPAFATALGPDPEALAEAAASDDARAEVDRLTAAVGDRALLLRIDRIEPSKNILRGFAAYDLVLAEHPELRERVVFVALLYPSREGLADYLAYRQEVELAVDMINDRWSTSTWQPVLLDTEDNYARSIGALTHYDVLLVNPIRDGLNLVAKEGPVLNRRHGLLALSRDAGAFEELEGPVFEVHPYDIAQTADALHAALTLDPGERARRSARTRELASARTPRDWLDDLVARARH